MREIVIEKMSSTALTPGMAAELEVAIGIIEDAINEDVDGMYDVLEFLKQFEIDSKRTIAIDAFDIEPRACGSCHMLTHNYDGDRDSVPKNLKCVYGNGPEFEYGSVAIWFKLCEYYLRQVD